MKDIIDSLKIRLNNPFLISFVISWPFWNWEIVIGLIFYKSDSLPKYMGCNNFIDLIDHHSSFFRTFGGPAISALIYIFIFPLIKYLISNYSARITTREETDVLRISEKGTVPTSEYVKAVQKADEELKVLSEIIKDNTKVLEEKNSLVTKNSVIETELSDIKSQNSDLSDTIKDLQDNLVNCNQEKSKYYDDLQKLESKLSHKNKSLLQLEYEKIELSLNLFEINKGSFQLIRQANINSNNFELILNGTWNVNFDTNRKRYNTQIKIENNKIVSYYNGSELYLYFTEINNYILNHSEKDVMLSFKIEMDINSLMSKSEEMKNLNELIYTYLQNEILVGKSNDKETQFTFFKNNSIKITMEKI